MKYRDTIVAEVRRAREEYARRFNYDLDAIYADLQEKQKRYPGRLVSFVARSPQLPPGEPAPNSTESPTSPSAG